MRIIRLGVGGGPLRELGQKLRGNVRLFRQAGDRRKEVQGKERYAQHGDGMSDGRRQAAGGDDGT